MGLGCHQPWANQLGGLSWLHGLFCCPQGGLKGLAISTLTCLSGVFWAMVIIHGSALEPAWSILGYLLTGVVAFLMCIQAKQQWLGFGTRDFYRCLRHLRR
ncbi:Inner membrane protein ycdZ [Serratia fonticola]|uniref:Inner membrane protein ycdZ n=1 Tax=Serratia fonticola TaxID=47917 RepID=A0A4V6KVZ9_SERFO|nr:Inner membrane protein ycdZ [Serratia fonticola]